MNTIKTTHRIVLSLIMTLALFSSCSNDDESSEITPESDTVAIPDVNFEQALIDLNIDTNGLNGNILITDAEPVIELEIIDKNISSLQGIEAFVSLKHLSCDNNNLASLDLSANTELELFSATNNQLTELNLQSNINLNSIRIYENLLKSLDVSNLAVLMDLSCSYNAIEILDLSNNSALTAVYCDYNALISLNIKNENNTSLISLNARSNPNLYCVQVDDASFSTSNWSNCIDGFTAFGENCN